MRKIDFISASPYLSIFEKGANQTIFGGILFLINGIIFIILTIIYLYDFFTNPNYTFNYTLVKENYNKTYKNSTTDEHDDIFLSDFKLKTYLKKDGVEDLSNNFLVIDLNKLYRKPKDSEGYKIISEKEDYVIKQGEEYQKSALDFQLGVIYRCHGENGTNCTIRKEDKIEIDSYHLLFLYRGYNIDHQSETQKNPIEEFPELEDIQFLETTNIIFLNWKLIEYEEKKGIFGELFDKIIGK